MPRNIVLCCDGTSNEFATDHTNVAKLCQILVKNPASQTVFYQPGLGTIAPPGFATGFGAFVARSLGLAFGYGIRSDIRNAYVYIMNHWEPGDRLFLFGFSRGAYTVRALAALIHMYGLAMPGNEPLIPYAIRMLWRINRKRRRDPQSVKRGFELARDFRKGMTSGDCRIDFLGVWDTVSSVGWVSAPVALPYTQKNESVLVARHAVAIGERRAFFRTNMLTQARGQDLVQLWFPGDHCDVGGGHVEADSGLSKYALQWMVAEAEEKGLLIDSDRLAEMLGENNQRYARPVSTAPMHESLSWKWWICEFFPKKHRDRSGRTVRRMNLFSRRDMDEEPLVHPVAWEICPDRLPPGARRPE